MEEACEQKRKGFFLLTDPDEAGAEAVGDGVPVLEEEADGALPLAVTKLTEESSAASRPSSN